MATRKKRSAPRRAAAPRAAAPRRRRSGAMKGVSKIPKLTTAAGILAVNGPNFVWAAKNAISNPSAGLNYFKASAKAAIRPDNIAKTAKAAAIGYGIGWVAKKYAPKLVKKPMAKIANKVM